MLILAAVENEIAIDRENTPLYYDIISKLAWFNHKMGDISSAEDFYRRYFEQVDKEDFSYLTTSVKYGYFLIEIGEYENAERQLSSMLDEIKRTFGAKRKKDLDLFAMIGLGLVNQILERHDVSQDYFEKVLGRLYRHKEYLALTNNFYGQLNTVIGKYQIAERQLQKAKTYYETQSNIDYLDYVTVLGNLGILYSDLGNYDKSEQVFKQALVILQDQFGSNQARSGSLIGKIADVMVSTGRYAQADSLYLEALGRIEKSFGRDHPEFWKTKFKMARLAHFENEETRAKELLQEIENHLEKAKSENSDFRSRLWAFKGLMALEGKSFTEAIKLFENALNTYEKLNAKKDLRYLIYLSYLGMSLQGAEEDQTASLLYKRYRLGVINDIEKTFSAMSESEKTSYISALHSTYDPYVSFAIRNANPQNQMLSDLLNFSMATKGIIFKSINRTRELVMKSGDLSLQKKYKDWIRLKDLLSEYQGENDRLKSEKGIELEELRTDVGDLEKYITKSASAFEFLESDEEVSWQRIQDNLEADEAVIEVVRFQWYNKVATDSVFYAFLVISPQAITPTLVLIKNGNDLEGKYLENYRNSIQFKVEDGESYMAYWSSLKEVVRGFKRIYFSPDGVYNMINLNTLQDPDTKKYLIDQIEIKQISGLPDMLSTNADGINLDQTRKLAFLGFPDYEQVGVASGGLNEGSRHLEGSLVRFSKSGKITVLPGTKQEVEKISGILTSQNFNSEVYLGSRASEETLKSLEQTNVLHIATHGFFFSDPENVPINKTSSDAPTLNPLFRSGLLLAGAQKTIDRWASGNTVSGEDGIFTAFEAANLFLTNTDLVVLSACETGLGEVKNGEGVYGLQRSLLTAGAKKVIMSLWKVSDQATQDLMTEFYRAWTTGITIDQAFRQAQLKIRKKYPEPYNWGAFILLGS